ncbi:MAG TPA: HisA/HisF-related TIM barrel protein [Gemmatimonadaceae bacterium]|nr:HisA/HisF-related TIM barrel protein [Gemmatimonadaceae bacterium]
MRVIPVLDLKAGRAVHARGGARDHYAPVHSRLAPDAPGDAAALASAYVHALGARELYVADLDAITGNTPQRALLRTVAECGAALWMDTGIAGTEDAQLAVMSGATRVVIGLETLPAFSVLESIARELGRERVVFSLDLRHGAPLLRAGAPHGGTAHALVQHAARAGAGTVIVLDLARVGASSGADLALIEQLRAAAPDLELVAGGGIRHRADLEQLADAGCVAALVATALHDGRLARADIDAVAHRG